MRHVLERQLAALEQSVIGDLELAAATVSVVARCVADTSMPTPSSVEVSAEALKKGARDVDRELLTTIALRAPVACDLRLIIALMHIAHHEMLIANQFVLITEQLMETDPDVPALTQTTQRLVRMAGLAAAQLTNATSAITRRDAGIARDIERDDDIVDKLNREIFTTTVSAGGSELERDVAVRHLLIARCLERIADNAVDIAGQVGFIVTG